MKEIQEKLANLEMKFSFQDDLLENLNEAMINQRKEVEDLAVKIKYFEELLNDCMKS